MKTGFKSVIAGVLALILALSLMVPALAEDVDTIKIGVIGPLTQNDAAAYGEAVRNGAQIAADEINANPDAVLKIELDIQDDQNDVETALNAYSKLLDDEVQMILGTVTTTPCVAVAANAFSDRMFMLTPSASSAQVTEGKDNVFQVCFTDPAQGVASAQYIAQHALGTKVGVIYNNADVYSMGIRDTFVAEMGKQGMEVVAESTFNNETTDFSVQVTAMKNAGVDVLFLPIYYTPASQILTVANANDYAPIFFGVDGMDGILTSVEGFDTSLAEGVMLLTPFAADAQDDLTVNFVTKYNELYQQTPNQFAADAYDGVYALYNACVAAGITGETSFEDACEKLIEVFPNLQVPGLTGTMTWASNGEVSKTPTAVVIKDGVYVSADNVSADQ